MNRKEWYESILNEIAKNFKRGNPSVWKNRDYLDLNAKIFEATKVDISITTLKRIYGIVSTKQNYFPHPATIEALRQFSGITTTEPKEIEGEGNSYLENIDFESQTQEKDTNFELNTPNKSNKDTFKRFAFIGFGSILVATLAIWFYQSKLNINSKAVLSLASKNDNKSFYTAYFKYQLPKIDDSCFFVTGTKIYPPMYLDPNSSSVNYLYNAPGLYFPHIKTRKEIISDSVPILVETNGWESIIGYYYLKPDDKFYRMEMDKVVEAGCFHPTKKTINSYGMDTTRYILCNLENYKKTKENGDEFEFTSTIRNSFPWPGLIAHAIEIKIVGENGVIAFEIVNKGCSYLSYAKMGEVNLKGDKVNLEGLSDDFSRFRTIAIKNVNKEVSFYVDDSLKYTNKYTKSIGNLVGISFVFHGSGFVKSIDLKKANKKESVFKF